MRKRTVSLSILLCVIGVILAGKLLWTQIIRGHHYEDMALGQTEGIQTLYSPRGTIYDRNGKELAFSIMVKSLYADPGMMNVSPEEAAKELAPLLHKKEGDLVKAMSQETRFVWLERIMDPEDSEKVEELLKDKKWKGFGFLMKAEGFIPTGKWRLMYWALWDMTIRGWMASKNLWIPLSEGNEQAAYFN